MGEACAKREARIEREELVTPGWLTSLPLFFEKDYHKIFISN